MRTPSRTFARALLAVAIVLTLLAGQGCALMSASPVATSPTATATTPTTTPATPTAEPIDRASTAARAAQPTPPDAAPAPPNATPATNAVSVGLPSIAPVADSVRPAVVFIAVQGVAVGDFFQPVPISGVGSGVIFDSSGLIVTNNHVIENARTIRVVLPDGRTFDGQLVGRDPQTDLAVVKIDGTNLPSARFGDSSRLQIGEWVIAIGNALGLEGGPTVTVGVVSALGRSIEVPGNIILEDLIQTDAAINPGNSGGPLINLAGEVIGINTAAPGPTRTGYQPSGIGFAISINHARPIIDQIVQFGRVRRPWLGVEVVTLTPSLAAQLGAQVREGVVIGRIVRNSPAAQAGLQPGDIIVEIAGVPVRNTRDLSSALAQQQIGDEVLITVVRNGERVEIPLTLEEAPSVP